MARDAIVSPRLAPKYDNTGALAVRAYPKWGMVHNDFIRQETTAASAPWQHADVRTAKVRIIAEIAPLPTTLIIMTELPYERQTDQRAAGLISAACVPPCHCRSHIRYAIGILVVASRWPPVRCASGTIRAEGRRRARTATKVVQERLGHANIRNDARHVWALVSARR